MKTKKKVEPLNSLIYLNRNVGLELRRRERAVRKGLEKNKTTWQGRRHCVGEMSWGPIFNLCTSHLLLSVSSQLEYENTQGCQAKLKITNAEYVSILALFGGICIVAHV